jgi:hypothetical protein
MVPDHSSMRIEQFRGEPLPPPSKNAKIKNVARIFLKIQTESGKFMDALQSAMSSEKRYQNLVRTTKGGVATASAGKLTQAYELRSDIEKRPSSEFVRKLAASVPPKPGRGSADSGDDGGFGSGGFGGGGFGGGGFRRGGKGPSVPTPPDDGGDDQ